MGERGRKSRAMGRVVVAVAIFLFIGAAVNVLVTWGIAFVYAMDIGAVSSDKKEVLTEWPYAFGAGWGKPQYSARYVHRWSTVDVAEWDADPSAAGGANGYRGVYVYQVGYPSRGLMFRVEVNGGGGWGRGYDLWTVPQVPGPGYAALPLRPRPWAFTLNAVVYGAIAWGGVWAWKRARRRRRKRRNQCLACGYSRAGLVGGAKGVACPECGVSVVGH